MRSNITKSRLGILLSKLDQFKSLKVRLEQYTTDPEIAADILWKALYLGDIKGKVIGDMGCGVGILGLGALILGAQKVILIDIDDEAISIAKSNYHIVKSETSIAGKAAFKTMDIKDFKDKLDCVIENPPFGIKNVHADRAFLLKAIKIAPVIYSFHKSESLSFLKSFCKDNNMQITHVWNFNFPLKATYTFHQKRIQRIKVSCYRLERKII